MLILEMLDRKRKNEAVTSDGAPYNKRSRPEYYLPSKTDGPAAPGYDEQPDHEDGAQEDDDVALEEDSIEGQEDVSEPSEHDDDPNDASKPDVTVTTKRSAKSTRPRQDPTYGQRGAFPGLDEDGSADGEDAEALAYLRMVR